MSRILRCFLTRGWWASAPSVPGTPGEPPVDPENAAPIVANAIPDQNATEGELFTFAFAADTFSDADLDPLTYTATLAGGTPLPAWLTFTPLTRTFSGTPPNEVTLSIRVTADDGQGGTVSDVFALVAVAAEVELPTLVLSDGDDLITLLYTPLSNERNKPPVVEDLEITSDAGMEVGATLTATMTGHMQGPFTEGTHEYQWYTSTIIMDAVLTPIVGATSDTYVIQSGDYGKYITCRARFVQVEGSNNTSEWFYAELTSAVTEAAPIDDGDIDHLWADFFEIENGGSIPSNWNDSGVAVSLLNLGTEDDWTAAAATKPAFDVDKLVFANAHRITGYSTTHPPVFEVWIKARFTGPIGNILSLGNQTLFGLDSSGRYVSNGLTPQDGDTDEHIFRIVFNGASSLFQYDGGEEVGFDEGTAIGTVLVMGQTNGGASLGDFEIKRFQRTDQGTLLTEQEVIDKWAYHGFDVGGGELEDIAHAWEDFFEIETGASIPPDWNDALVDPELINLGINANWTAVDATKPTYDDATGELVFANAHRVAGITQTFPPVVEIWIKGKFTANNGAIIGWGSQTLFGMNSSSEYIIRDQVMGAGDLNEHVFRIVLNGAASIFQIDNGTETIFDENFTSATSMALGQTFAGSNLGDFRLKRFQRTADGTVLTAPEVAEKWAYHGF